MQRYVSESIDNPAAGDHPFERADLVFYGVDHSGPSFEARVFLNDRGADASTDRDDPSFAGSFTVFGHGGCAGDVGHCDVPTGPRDPFDRRPPHALTPQTKTVIVTEALRGRRSIRLRANLDDFVRPLRTRSTAFTSGGPAAARPGG